MSVLQENISEIGEKLLFGAFPFYVGFTTVGDITGIGKSLGKMLPSIVDTSEGFLYHFDIEQPRRVAAFEDLVNHAGQLIVLRSRHDKNLVLRGELIFFDGNNQALFIGSPWIAEVEDLSSLGVSLNDFPIHSTLADFLMLTQSQRSSLRDSQHMSEELGKLNRELEDRVERRTMALQEKAAELTESRKNLELEMQERQRMEVELRHAQKLESIGQLAAGIAHEVNTPMQFIGSSLQFMQSAFDDLLSLASSTSEFVDNHTASVPSVADLQLLRQTIEDSDLEYLHERAPSALQRALDGIDRVTVIVSAMKEFSHPDQSKMTSEDINRAIETTLVVAENEYKYIATIDNNLGDIPQIQCHAGDINQVFLNLIVNAAHAIYDNSDLLDGDGRIEIKTWSPDDNTVMVSVSDNGCGIPDVVHHRIFDPFFTTKDVGRGTGQGLSISHQIVVEKHGGSLYFETIAGEGTTFFVKLPVTPTVVDSGSDDQTASLGAAA